MDPPSGVGLIREIHGSPTGTMVRGVAAERATAAAIRPSVTHSVWMSRSLPGGAICHLACRAPRAASYRGVDARGSEVTRSHSRNGS